MDLDRDGCKDTPGDGVSLGQVPWVALPGDEQRAVELGQGRGGKLVLPAAEATGCQRHTRVR